MFDLGYGSSGLGFNQLSFVGSLNGKRVAMSSINALELGSVVLQTEDTWVFADEVIVSGEVRTEGCSLRIVCRKLTFETDSRIVANGRAATTSFPPELRPQNTHAPGEAGLPGGSGSDGFDAGSVTIIADNIDGEAWIEAKGGAGGRGQDGGNGSKGAPGINGVVVYIGDRQNPAPAASGGNGGPGGPSGPPGTSGQGGKFGQVSIAASGPFRRRVEVDSGNPGPPATAGDSGNGGDPGSGANVLNHVCRGGGDFRLSRMGVPGGSTQRARIASLAWKSSEFPIRSGVPYDGSLLTASLWRSPEPGHGGGHCSDDLWYRAPDGQPGPKPPKLSDANPLPRVVVPVGDGIHIDEKLDWEAMAIEIEPLFLDLYVCALENEYAESGTVPPAPFYDRLAFAYQLGETKSAPSQVKRECRARVYTMRRKISLGLDYFGLTPSFIPLLSVNTYSETVEKMLPALSTIEQSFQKYWEKSEANNVAIALVDDVAKQAESQILVIKAETDRIIKATMPLLEQMKALDFQVAHCWEILVKHQAELDAAIKARNDAHAGDCDALQSIKCIAVIVASVYTGGAALAAGVGAGATLLSDLEGSQNLWDDRRVLGEDFKAIGDADDKVEASILKLQAAWKKLNAKQPDINLSTPPQFRMNKKQLDEVCDTYARLGFKEADAYREAGYAYLKCVETRNDMIVDYNGLLLQLISQFSKQSSGIRLVSELKSKRASTFDPSDVWVKSMMSRIYLDSLNFAAQMVYAERKALNYHYAEALDAPISKFNYASIAIRHSENLVLAKGASEAYRAVRKIRRLELDVSNLCDPSSIESFKQTRELLFVIRRDGFYEPLLERFSGFRITGMELLLPGAKVKQGYTSVPWWMVQSGTEYIYKSDGSFVKFTHREILFQGDTSLIGADPTIDSDFSADGMYAGVSPFAQWILHLSQSEKLELDLSALTGVSLVITGYMVEGL